jgi:diaminohydroxyphosphoribosylaminopyrimidine deaminase/5-amino-6-(5-phosphoribosylamino)uracil reductase
MTLEPCAKRSSTALSCTVRLLNAGVTRVVIAAEDPHPFAAGNGVKYLREAGIEVEVGLCGEEARALNHGFFLRVVEKRPLVCADSDRSRYDAVFNPPPGEAPRAVLERLATAGLTRMCVEPGGDLAQRLERDGLLSPIFRLLA